MLLFHCSLHVGICHDRDDVYLLWLPSYCHARGAYVLCGGKMIKTIFNLRLLAGLLVSLFFILYSSFSNAGAALNISTGPGAYFDPALGIRTQSSLSAPFQFTPAANGAYFNAARTIPITGSTSTGLVSGAFVQRLAVAKNVAVALGKGLAKLAVPITIGSALYDAYQAAGATYDANGNPVLALNDPKSFYVYAGGIFVNGSTALEACDKACPVQYGACIPPAAPVGGDCHVKWPDGTTHSLFYNGAAIPSGTSVPFSKIQSDAAVEAFALSSAANAARIATDAQAKGFQLPVNTPYDNTPPPYSFFTPYVPVSTTTDSLGNVNTVEKKTGITFTPGGVKYTAADFLAEGVQSVPVPVPDRPWYLDMMIGSPGGSYTPVDSGVTLGSPSPVKVVESSKNSTNAVQQTVQDAVVAVAAPGVSPSLSLAGTPNPAAAPSSASSVAAPTDCEKFPDSLACSSSANDLPDVNLTDKAINLMITPISLGGSGSCPADVHFGSAGPTAVWTWTPYCNFANGVKPIILSFAWLAAAYILLGVKSNG